MHTDLPQTERTSPLRRPALSWAPVILFATLAGVLVVSGCSSESKTARHMRRAGEHFEGARYEEAILESMNVLKADNRNPQAIRHIALANLRLGKYREAFPFLVRATELMPEDLDLRLSLAKLYQGGGVLDKARAETLAVLDIMPTNVPALFLLLETITTPLEASNTLAVITEQATALDDTPLFHIARGNLQIRMGDRDAARSAFLRAREIDSESAAASLSLAALHTAEGRDHEASQEYERALRQAPKNLLARVKWADFEIKRGNFDAADDILANADATSEGRVLVVYHRARVQLAKRNPDACLELLEEVLAEKNDFADALLLKGNALLLKGKPDEASAMYEALLRKNPKAAAIRYRLGLARLGQGRTREAIAELNRTTDDAPAFLDARLLLAQLSLRTGNAKRTIELVEPVVDRAPEPERALMLLAAAQLSEGQPAAAETAVRKVIAIEPEDPRAPYLLGQILSARQDAEGARNAYATALKADPRFTPALVQLVTMDLQADAGDTAVERIQDHITQHPDDAGAILLLGRTHLALGHADVAEEYLLKSVKIEPGLTGAYITLGRMYASGGRTDEALAKFKAAHELNPDNPSTLMLQAMLYQNKGDAERAIQQYEKILARRPGFLAAANNLAYLYGQNPATLDRAYELARTAHESVPDNPYVADTFGWILYRGGEHKWALTILQKTEEALADVPEALYHLGMVHYALGHEDQAVHALRGALAAGESEFEGIENAKQVLETIELTPSMASARQVLAQTETLLATNPENLAAKIKQAVALALLDKPQDALAAYQDALQDAPFFAPAWMEIARLQIEHFGDPEKALAAAEEARKLAPDDPRVTGLQGWISFLQGNHKRALALLRDSSAATGSDDPQTLYRLGLAYFSQGNLSRATQQVQRALASETAFAEEQGAERFMKMMRLYPTAETFTQIPDEVRQALNEDPDYAPALLVAAVVDQAHGRNQQAIDRYESVLRQYPDVELARARLAGLYAVNDATKEKAYELATRARLSLPADADLARILGILVFERGEYPYAITLLEQTTREMPTNVEGHYYLGMSHYHLGEMEKARHALARVVSFAPDSPLATRAEATITAMGD